jgi:hypothetical protein
MSIWQALRRRVWCSWSLEERLAREQRRQEERRIAVRQYLDKRAPRIFCRQWGRLEKHPCTWTCSVQDYLVHGDDLFPEGLEGCILYDCGDTTFRYTVYVDDCLGQSRGTWAVRFEGCAHEFPVRNVHELLMAYERSWRWRDK